MLETVVGLCAVAIVTFMVVWMRRHARGLKGELEAHAAAALAQGSVFALVAMAFFAVLREGLETAVFLLAAFQAADNRLAAGAGALLGVITAVIIGAGLYRGGIRINLARFFRITSAALVIVAAGLLATAAHTAHEAAWLNSFPGPGADLQLAGRARDGDVLPADRHARPPAASHLRRGRDLAALRDPDARLRPLAPGPARPPVQASLTIDTGGQLK